MKNHCASCDRELGPGTVWGRLVLPGSGAVRAICLACYTDPERNLVGILEPTAAAAEVR